MFRNGVESIINKNTIKFLSLIYINFCLYRLFHNKGKELSRPVYNFDLFYFSCKSFLSQQKGEITFCFKCKKKMTRSELNNFWWKSLREAPYKEKYYKKKKTSIKSSRKKQSKCTFYCKICIYQENNSYKLVKQTSLLARPRVSRCQTTHNSLPGHWRMRSEWKKSRFEIQLRGI